MPRTKVKRFYRTSETLSRAERGQRAATLGRRLISEPPGNAFRHIQACHGVIKGLLDHCEFYAELCRTWDSMALDDTPNDHLPWGSDEDEVLIQWRVEGRSMAEIARHLGRTPAAAATRLSTLVGVPRSDMKQMFLDGKLDGEAVRGLFEGRAKAVAS